jgi:hypothetical protein
VPTPLRTRLSRARGRVARALALLVIAFVAATTLPVLALRWVDPWTSAFMIAARKDAALAGDWRSANRYEWRDFDAIAPHAAMAVIAAEDSACGGRNPRPDRARSCRRRSSGFSGARSRGRRPTSPGHMA